MLMTNARKSSNRSQNKSSTQNRTASKRQRSAASPPTQACGVPRVARIVILTIIGLVTILVVTLTVLALNVGTEDQVEAKISRLTRTYYENYYYPNAFSDQTAATDFLSRFTESGLAPVSLRQLLLTAPGVTEDDKTFLRKYCNENTTVVHYYPEAPYAQDSYRPEITYACKFD